LVKIKISQTYGYQISSSPQSSYYTEWAFPAPEHLMVYMKTTSYLTKTCITPTSRSVNCL
jgi:hypothetical protein